MAVLKSVRNLARWILPHGLVALLERVRLLQRLGVPNGRMPASLRIRDLPSTRLTLFPDGALSQMNMVIDVGAHTGMWSRAVMATCRPGRLIAIEPSTQVHSVLRANLAHLPEVEIIPVAAGDEDTDVTFHHARHPAASSVLRPRAQASNIYGTSGFETISAMQVPQRRLDTLLPGSEPVSLIKIDVQGREAAVLSGAKQVLSRTHWLLLEVLLISRYEDDTIFPDLHRLACDAGFKLTAIAPLGRRGNRPLSYTDALYENELWHNS